MNKVAFLFPGQGSQYLGMGRQFFELYPAAQEIFHKADQALGFSLSKLCFEGPEENLAETANTQPAVLTVSLACLEVLKKLTSTPAAVAGHSVGEYSALVASGSLSFEDAVKIVRKRGQYMQEAVPLGKGGMVAILGVDTGIIEEICQKSSNYGVIEIANFNCPGQVVVAGETAALEEAQSLVRNMGAGRCVLLPVSAPFHCSLMHPAAKQFQTELEQIVIKEPKIPIISNVSADYPKSAEEIKQSLIKQVYRPVKWEESINRLLKDGVSTFVEVGPGKVLSGLVKRTSRQARTLNVEDQVSLEKFLAFQKEVS